MKKQQGCYLIHLSGNGDTTIKVVNKPTWNYIFSPPPKFTLHCAEEILPNGVENETKSTSIQVTSGSYENDRALQVKGIETFYSLSDYTKWIKKNKVKIINDYEGGIY